MPGPGSATVIAQAFGLGDGARLSDTPVARGKQGQVWRLDTTRGRWAVKEPFRRSTETAVTDSVAFQEAVHAAGVMVPRVLRTVHGNVFADVGRAQVRVDEWVDLLPPNIGADPIRVGRTVAGIHLVQSATGDPFDSWFCEPVGADRWDVLIKDLRAAGAPFAEFLARMRAELIALEQWVRPPRHLQTCHRDLWADNMRPTPAGDLCVIDWHDCGLADPSQELACVLFEFGSGNPARLGTLYRAYVDAGGPGRVDGTEQFSMLICQLGHIGEAACRDWLKPNPRSPHRDDSAASFAELVDRPHHRTALMEILDAVSSH